MTAQLQRSGGLILFSEGFRIFFLSAAVYGIVAMLVWLGWLALHAAGGALTELPFAPPPHQWHAHEMIFGYGTAALAGFFLTAVPSWTGAPPSRVAFIATLALVWLAGRLAVFFSSNLPPVTVMAVDLLFIPLLSWKVLSNLLKRPKPQNMIFVGLLGLLLAGNIAVHLEWTLGYSETADTGLIAGLLTLAAMIAVLGGRVTPAFTRNAIQRDDRATGLPISRFSFELAGVTAAIALPLMILVDADNQLLSAVAAAAAVANAARLAGWRALSILDQPILWSLHLGFLMLVLGYGALALHLFGLDIGRAAAIHLLGIGAIGGMTLAVMSRAALGHTGRPLIAPSPIPIAYGLIAIAALVRAFGIALVPERYYAVMFVSGGLWILAFTIFLVVYAPIFTRPRVKASPA